MRARSTQGARQRAGREEGRKGGQCAAFSDSAWVPPARIRGNSIVAVSLQTHAQRATRLALTTPTRIGGKHQRQASEEAVTLRGRQRNGYVDVCRQPRVVEGLALRRVRRGSRSLQLAHLLHGEWVRDGATRLDLGLRVCLTPQINPLRAEDEGGEGQRGGGGEDTNVHALENRFSYELGYCSYAVR